MLSVNGNLPCTHKSLMRIAGGRTQYCLEDQFKKTQVNDLQRSLSTEDSPGRLRKPGTIDKSPTKMFFDTISGDTLKTDGGDREYSSEWGADHRLSWSALGHHLGQGLYISTPGGALLRRTVATAAAIIIAFSGVAILSRANSASLLWLSSDAGQLHRR